MMNAYREPFTDPAGQEPALRWPNELPLAGEPVRNVKVIDESGQWLKTSDTLKLM
jgi:haloalkane dehalogenase